MKGRNESNSGRSSQPKGFFPGWVFLLSVVTFVAAGFFYRHHSRLNGEPKEAEQSPGAVVTANAPPPRSESGIDRSLPQQPEQERAANLTRSNSLTQSNSSTQAETGSAVDTEMVKNADLATLATHLRGSNPELAAAAWQEIVRREPGAARQALFGLF